jgi:hypothetical protein
VDVASGIDQQVDESGMEIVAGDQHGLGTDHLDFAIRDVDGKVDGSGGNVSLVRYENFRG